MKKMKITWLISISFIFLFEITLFSGVNSFFQALPLDGEDLIFKVNNIYIPETAQEFIEIKGLATNSEKWKKATSNSYIMEYIYDEDEETLIPRSLIFLIENGKEKIGLIALDPYSGELIWKTLAPNTFQRNIIENIFSDAYLKVEKNDRSTSGPGEANLKLLWCGEYFWIQIPQNGIVFDSLLYTLDNKDCPIMLGNQLNKEKECTAGMLVNGGEVGSLPYTSIKSDFAKKNMKEGIAFPSSIINSTAIVSEVPLYSQGGTRNCWAYSLAMVHQWWSPRNLGTGDQQTQYMRTYLNKTVNDGATLPEMAQIMQNWVQVYTDQGTSGWDYEPFNYVWYGEGQEISTASPTTLVTDPKNWIVNHEAPVICSIDSAYNGGNADHVVVVTGYNDNLQTIYINNPWGLSTSFTYSYWNSNVWSACWLFNIFGGCTARRGMLIGIPGDKNIANLNSANTYNTITDSMYDNELKRQGPISMQVDTDGSGKGWDYFGVDFYENTFKIEFDKGQVNAPIELGNWYTYVPTPPSSYITFANRDLSPGQRLNNAFYNLKVLPDTGAQINFTFTFTGWDEDERRHFESTGRFSIFDDRNGKNSTFQMLKPWKHKLLLTVTDHVHVLDDDTAPPTIYNMSSNPGASVNCAYNGDISLQADVTDPSGLLYVHVIYRYGSGSEQERSYAGYSGNTFYFSIPYSEWSQHRGEYLYWKIKASDNDHDRNSDNSVTTSSIAQISIFNCNYIISGYVRTSSGNGISGVTMTGFPSSPTTNSSGYYSYIVNYGWSGTVIPQKDCYNFSPDRIQYPTVTSDMSNQNYTGSLKTFTISGYVRYTSGLGISGATMSGFPTSTTTDGNGFYSCIVNCGWVGIVTPQKSGHTFTPSSKSYNNVSSDISTENYTGVNTTTYTISGFVKDSSGLAISGVAMSGFPATTTSAGDGFYSCIVINGWGGTVTPQKTGYTFTPPNKSYNNVSSDISNENYTGINTTTYTISGFVKDSSGLAISGVAMSGFPATTTSAGDGFYSCNVMNGWSGVVTPQKTGYTFTPPNKSYNNVTSDKPNENYTGVNTTTYTISGFVKDSSGLAISGVAMSGFPATTTSAGDGFYSCNVMNGWSGVVTPQKTGYTFTPPNKSYSNVTSDKSNENYTGTPNTISFTISGFVKDTSGNGINGVNMDGFPVNTTTAGDGFYSCNVMNGWSGVVTPQKTGYTFTPPNISYTNVISDKSNENYTGREISGKEKMLIIDLDGNKNSAGEIKAAIEASGYNTEYMNSFPQGISVNEYTAAFVCLGIYPSSHVLTASEGDILKNYLANGGRLYMEGGDTWSYDPSTPAHPYFGVTGVSDGQADTGTVNGAQGAFTQGISFQYEGDNSYMDRIAVNNSAAGAFIIWKNQGPDYNNGVARDQNSFKTIGVSFEFGGLPSYLQTSVMQKYINFFKATTQAKITLVSPNGGEVLTGGSKHTITWTGTKTFNSIDIEYFDGAKWNVIINGTQDDGKYEWKIPNISTTNAKLWIKGRDGDTDPTDYTDNPFTIVPGTIASITIKSPNGGEVLTGGSKHTITWTGTKTFNSIDIEYFDGAKWNVIINGTQDDGKYEWRIPNISTTNGKLWIKGWDGNTNPTDYTDNPFTMVSNNIPPKIEVNRKDLNFGALTTGTVTSPQTFSISNVGGGSLNWSLSSNAAWLSFNPVSGSGAGPVSVSINPTGLSAGAYTGVINLIASGAINSPQTISVTLNVYNNPTSKAPFGDFATPEEGTTAMGSIAVTGWALDDLEVSKVEIFREEQGKLLYIGDVCFVEGARPDVEKAYPGYPFNYKAGWGYLMLTNFLPNGGNGDFKLQAIATDIEGNSVSLGTKTIYCDNAHAVKPFGAIDTPTQGGITSGNQFINWGWVLTPRPNSIPINGSTINVYVDSINIGHPKYNNYRQDIATLFPGYSNSSGAVGYFLLDTANFTNGMHTIFWIATDSAGNSDSVGSRYFSVQNTAVSDSSFHTPGYNMESVDWNSFDISLIDSIPIDDLKYLKVNIGFKDNNWNIIKSAGVGGVYDIQINELDHIEIEFSTKSADMIGFTIIGNKLRPLPIGSTLDVKNRKFHWIPGPGFLGEYHFLFIEREGGKSVTMQKVNLTIKSRLTKKEHR